MDAEKICKRFHSLRALRSNLDSVLDDIETYVCPYRGEFYKPNTSEHEVDWRKRELWDDTAVIAAQRLASHMHGSLCSPAVKWFGLRYRDDALNENQAAAEWLEDCEERMWHAIQESDFNSGSPEVFYDLVTFATSFMLLEPKGDDIDDFAGLDFTPWPVKDTYIEMGADDMPYALYRGRMMTRVEILDMFPDADPDNLPGEDDVDTRKRVIFCIYYRDKSKVGAPGRLAPKLRPVGYKYVLDEGSVLLKEGGYYEFPGFAPRWAKVSGSNWGYSPAMLGLATIRMLNETKAQVWEARAKMIDPPWKTTDGGLVGDLDLVPGGLTVLTSMDDLEPLLNFTNFPEADNGIRQLQEQIDDLFFRDRLDLKDSPAMTATEVNARVERMMRLMAPNLGRIQNDFLNPLIQTVWSIMYRTGQFLDEPELPPDATLDIEFTGPIPRAQKMEVGDGIQMWLNSLAELAQLMPDLLDVPDTDFIARELARLRGVPAKAMRAEDEVQKIREQRQQAQQEAEQAAIMQAQGAALNQGAQAMGRLQQTSGDGE